MTPSTVSIKSNARIITSSITHHADRAGHVNKKPPNYFFLLLLTLLPPRIPTHHIRSVHPSYIKTDVYIGNDTETESDLVFPFS